MRKNKIFIFSLIFLLPLAGVAFAQTQVSIAPSTQEVSPGESFTVDISIVPDTEIAGAQFDLIFDAELIQANSVTEGNLLNQNGVNTFFNSGNINNNNGTITAIAGAITTPGETVSSPGIFVRINFTAKDNSGTSSLSLSNVIVGDKDGRAVFVDVKNGEVTVKASLISGESWFINCGGDEYIDPNGNLWMKDESFDYANRWGYIGDSVVSSTSESIDGTNLDIIYQTQRYGDTDFFYKINLPDGKYKVTLHFAEIYWQTPRGRIFDVALEGELILDDLDIYSEVGRDKALIKGPYIVEVSDNNLDITFPEIKQDNAQISGIQIEVINISNDNLLDFIQNKSFWFFWEEVNPDIGLIQDRAKNFGQDNYDVSSIASVGFGLTAICIAESRGWISREDAYQRILNTLKYFYYELENINGFFYHFVNMDTGERVWNCELSSIDTTLFLAGALFAGEYFKGTEIETLAHQIYERVNWEWMTDGTDFVNMSWYPETGFGGDWWNRYCEGILLNILAIGSPTHPIGIEAWSNMHRPVGSYGGYEFIYDYFNNGLFIHQYPQAWLDFRNIDDVTYGVEGHKNYFENSRRATLANRQFCIDHMGNYITYGPKSWGISAGDVPRGGYYGYTVSPGRVDHDGTIVPDTVAGSIVFTPTESIETLRNLYFKYKHILWGRYGFSNSFNLDKDWVSPDVIGIDKGMAIISIENHRTDGMVWDKFMNISYIQDALIAMGFSGVTEPGNNPPVAVASANPTAGTAPLTVKFYSTDSHDPDGTIVSYAWNFGDNNTSNEQNPTHTYQETGNYIAILTVTDNHGTSDIASVTITVEDIKQPPMAIISAVPTSGSVPLTVNFNASGSYNPDPDGMLTYLWNFGDGNISTEQNPTYTYQETGNYIAILTVTNNHGTSDIASVTITVSEATEIATIKGRVTDADNLDNPIEGALVKIEKSPFMVTQSSQSNNIYTDSQGYYSAQVEVPKPNTRFLVKASKSGYDYQIKQTPLVSVGDIVTVDLSLKKLEQQSYIPGEILVKVTGDILPAEVLNICGEYGNYEIDNSRTKRGRFLIKFEDSQVDLDKIIQELKQLSEVKYAIKNYIFIINF